MGRGQVKGKKRPAPHDEDEYDAPRKRKELVSVDAGGGSDLDDEGMDSDDSEAEFDMDDGESDGSDAEAAAVLSGMGRKSLLLRKMLEEAEAEYDEDEEDGGEGEGEGEEEGEGNSEDEEEDGDGVDGDEEGEEEDAQAEHEANGARRSTPYKNKQRVLLLSSRGITYRYRHLLTDLQSLLPHSKKDAKLDSKNKLNVLNELAELNNCNNCIYFEVRKKTDLYLWMSKTPNGPSVKFYVANVHTMDELRMTGNCLKGSRPLLSFDKNFDGQPHFQLLKEMFTQIFGTPRTSRKIKPFFDHILSFSIADDKIWFRNFQIVEKESTTKSKGKDISLVEIGPRFVLSIMRIFDGSFGGSTLFENPQFVSPNTVRRLRRQETQDAYRNRTQAALDRDAKLRDSKLPEDPLADVFR